MKTFTIRNVPEEMMEQLRHLAKQRNCSVNDLVVKAVERELDRWELHERVQRLAPVDGIDPTAAVREERNARDQAGL